MRLEKRGWPGAVRRRGRQREGDEEEGRQAGRRGVSGARRVLGDGGRAGS